MWAAERDVDAIGGVCADWGKVCVLPSPELDPNDLTLQGWQSHIRSQGPAYRALPAANGEAPVLDPSKGVALFDWPKEVATDAALPGFDLLLMTATEATLHSGQYPTAEEIAGAWKTDQEGNVMYLHNNRRYGITTFEDGRIQALLAGEPPNQLLSPTAP